MIWLLTLLLSIQVGWASPPPDVSALTGANESAIPDDPDVGTGIEGLPPGKPPPEHMVEVITQDIAQRLRCPVCQGLSVADSTSEAAVMMQRRIQELVAMGYPAEDIDDYFVSKYGEWVLLEPTKEGGNWIVWLGPVVMLGGGLIIAVLVVRFGDDDLPMAQDLAKGTSDDQNQLLAEVDDV